MTYSEYEQIFKKQNYETKPRVICSQKEQKKKARTAATKRPETTQDDANDVLKTEHHCPQSNGVCAQPVLITEYMNMQKSSVI